MTSTAPRRRRRAFSLNGLVIQVSAFALSFLLVALLVVGSSRAAFVEQNETVTERVPVAQETPEPADPYLPGPAPVRPKPTPTPRPDPLPEPVLEPEAPPEPVLDVALSDDAAGSAMFVEDEGLVPGVPEARCIRVTFDGTADPGDVRLYAASVSGSLASYLDLEIAAGPADGGAFGDCSSFESEAVLFAGTLADFGAGHAAFDTGLAAWDPTGPGEARAFRFTATVQDVPAAEGLSAVFGFTWETRD